MADRKNIPSQLDAQISPVSVIPDDSLSSNHPLKEQPQHPSSVGGDCTNTFLPVSKTQQIIRTACEKAYGTSLITDDDESFSSLDLPRMGAVTEQAVTEQADEYLPPIQIGRGGAEVSLEGLSLDDKKNDNPSSQEQPQPSPRQIGSLLDMEATPSPAPMKRGCMPYRPSPKLCADGRPYTTTPDLQKSYPFGPQLCCGSTPDISCVRSGDDTTAMVAVHQQESIEKTICYFLSNPDEVVDFLGSWQAWSYFGMGPTNSSPSIELKDDIKESLRNRACNMSARARHIRKLKGNMNPFDYSNDPNRCNEMPEISLNKAQSFCVANGPSFRPQFRKSSPSKRRSSPSRSDVSSSAGSSFISSILSCTDNAAGSDSPMLVPTRSNSYEDDLCYDSDPEEITRTVPKGRLSSLRRDESWENQDGPSEKIEPKRLDFDMNSSTDASVRATVEKILNERLTLIHHHMLDAIEGDTSNSPSAVKAWIEYGQQLRGKLIQPKYMWKPARESEQDMSKMGFSDSQLKSICLLDVVRIVEAERIGSCAQALAKSNHCFYIHSTEDTFLFEASSEMERNRIVQNLKIVVARLASLVIVEDRQIFQEFFNPSPFGGMGPGEKPVW